MLCEHHVFLKRHLPHLCPGKPEQGVLSLAQPEQRVRIFSCFPATYINQPLCVAPAFAYGPDRTRGEDSGADAGCSLGVRFRFFAGGADADSVAPVDLAGGRPRFRLGMGGADTAACLSFAEEIPVAAEVLRSSFALRGLRAPRFPDTPSHLETASAGPILAVWE